MNGDHFDPNKALVDAVAEVTGQEPLLRQNMVTVSFQETAVSPYRLVAVFESEADALLFLGSNVQDKHRWRYRMTTNRTIVLL